ncbi:MAG: hypothetical protein UT01_C0067G0010 [Candidatus Daviesbacteria bacterium GW2011_GWA1_38_7]|nr:MAG: hypothetical protein UT01_C0067G0010 [Candidatus Daviesbacteria bacterium GW2011_GWA1_38_7]
MSIESLGKIFFEKYYPSEEERRRFRRSQFNAIVLGGGIFLGAAGILIGKKLLKFLGSPEVTRITEVPKNQLTTPKR